MTPYVILGLDKSNKKGVDEFDLEINTYGLQVDEFSCRQRPSHHTKVRHVLLPRIRGRFPLHSH